MIPAVKRFSNKYGLKLIPRKFFLKDSIAVARYLIGAVIVTSIDNQITAGRIVETEAYPSYDAASHAFDGRITPRTTTQYKTGGCLYIYLIMGLHFMTSVVVGKKCTADVVFIRAIEPLLGKSIMRKRRRYAGTNEHSIAGGPGILSTALGITKDLNSAIINLPHSAVLIFNDPTYNGHIVSSKRINLGLHKFTPEIAVTSANKLWRFYEEKC